MYSQLTLLCHRSGGARQWRTYSALFRSDRKYERRMAFCVGMSVTLRAMLHLRRKMHSLASVKLPNHLG